MLYTFARKCRLALSSGYDKKTGAVQISAQDALRLHKAGKLMVIDTRGESEHKFSCIPGAVLLVPSKLGMGLCMTIGRGMSYSTPIPDVSEVPKDTTIVCACTAGLRSGFCANNLAKRFGRPVFNLHGGIISWFNHDGDAASTFASLSQHFGRPHHQPGVC